MKETTHSPTITEMETKKGKLSKVIISEMHKPILLLLSLYKKFATNRHVNVGSHIMCKTD